MAALVPRHAGLRFVVLALLLASVTAVLAPVARAAPGDLDPTFGANGSERLFQNPENLFLGAVTTQPDGKIVLAGGNESGVLLVRLLENGALDPSFGVNGMVSTAGLGTFAGADAVAVQPDGKIVVAGSVGIAGKEEILVVRYTPEGLQDPSFGGGTGFVTFPVGTKDANASAVAIGAEGRILVVGEAENLATNEIVAVAVLRPNGELDPSFSADGITTVESPVGDDRGEGIAETPGGGIVIADSAGAGAGAGFTIIKLLPSGTPDPAFGTAGIAQTPIPGSTAGRSDAIAVMPDGRIVAAGYGFDELAPGKLDSKFAAARYLADGKLDPSFGGGSGIFTQQLGSGDDSARFVGLTPTGKAVLAGSWEPVAESSSSPAALRLTTAGTLDPTFGSGGIVRRPVLAPFGDDFEAAALDPRERLVVVSSAFEGNNTVSVEVSRFLGDIPNPPPPPLVTVNPPAGLPNQPPHARIKKFGKAIEAAKLKAFSGTAADPEGEPLRKVQIALVRKGAGKTCLDLRNAGGRFKLVHRKQGKPCPQIWLDAKGTTKWSFKLTAVLPAGSYVLFARAVDAKGLAESTFSAADGNRVAFRVTA